MNISTFFSDGQGQDSHHQEILLLLLRRSLCQQMMTTTTGKCQRGAFLINLLPTISMDCEVLFLCGVVSFLVSESLQEYGLVLLLKVVGMLPFVSKTLCFKLMWNPLWSQSFCCKHFFFFYTFAKKFSLRLGLIRTSLQSERWIVHSHK